MTVKELRDALVSAPDDAIVIAEGCDCSSEVDRVEMLADVRAAYEAARDDPDADDDGHGWKFEWFRDGAAVLLRIE